LYYGRKYKAEDSLFRGGIVVIPYRLTPSKREPYELAPPKPGLEGWKAIRERIIAW
jgi:hypothetical protein